VHRADRLRRRLQRHRSFVDNITAGGAEAVVAAALLQISDGLHLRAVAEGIEKVAQAADLYRLGYRYAQGYHFGRPVPAVEIGRYRAALSAARLRALGRDI
jgi:EAL domain-containing protein (putative c-di-GMP-specific phosphodiesterase class I)